VRYWGEWVKISGDAADLAEHVTTLAQVLELDA
jgi:hypothetical protein